MGVLQKMRHAQKYLRLGKHFKYGHVRSEEGHGGDGNITADNAVGIQCQVAAVFVDAAAHRQLHIILLGGEVVGVGTPVLGCPP